MLNLHAIRESAETNSTELMHLRRQAVPTRLHLTLAALSFSVFAVYGSLVPLRYEPLELAEALARFRQVPMLQLSVESRADWVANLLLFMPLGFLWLGACSLDHPKSLSLLRAIIVVPVCAAASVGLEFTQLWFPNRTVSQNDIIAESIGAVVGVGVWIAIGQTSVDWLRGFTTDLRPRKQLDWLLQLYFVGFVVYALLPLDLTISFAELYRKFKEGRILLIPFSFNHDSLYDRVYQLSMDAIVFVPIGAWIATAFTHTNYRVRSPGTCAFLGAVLSAAIELAQIIVYSRFVDTSDIVTGTVGAAVGGWVVGRMIGDQAPASCLLDKPKRSWNSLVWTSAAILYAAMLMVIFWSPFQFIWDVELARQRWADFFRTPFEALYWGSEFHAVQQVLRKILFFAPLGGLMAQAVAHVANRGLRRLFLCTMLSAGVAFAIGIELGQLFLPASVPDATDVLLCSAGVVLGMTIHIRVFNGIAQNGSSPSHSATLA
jgi:VanZ family protein